MDMKILLSLSILLGTLVCFIWGKWRYDVVVLGALFISVVVGIVSPYDAFDGFGHKAVVTVIFVLIISQALQYSGIVTHISKPLGRLSDRPVLFTTAVVFIVAILSSFMNNVGALALLLPITLHHAKNPSMVLIPLSFGSLLGGLVTLIGTPPNIIIAEEALKYGKGFDLFSFTPAGGVIALVGLLFLCLVGWRLIPSNRQAQSGIDLQFKISDYLVELVFKENSKLLSLSLEEIEKHFNHTATTIGLLRDNQRLLGDLRSVKLQKDDVLIMRTDSNALSTIISNNVGVELAHNQDNIPEHLQSDRFLMMEGVISSSSRVRGWTVSLLQLRRRFGINILAIAREGEQLRKQIADIQLRPGDVLLFQGPSEYLSDNLAQLGILPLASREMLTKKKTPFEAWGPLGFFAVGIILTATGLLPVDIAFMGVVIFLLLFKLFPLEKLYDSIDWPVVILLGGMFPIGEALQTTGATDFIVNGLLAGMSGSLPDWTVIWVLLLITVLLSNIINNAATALIMAPIAASLAEQFGHSINPFLMVVAIGASCAFLTPIGHQNNLLVMGPGGYKFTDFWKVGLPLQILLLIITVPVVLLFWPL